MAYLASDSRSLTLIVGAARLSAELGLRVAVEGIETADQLELVRSEPFFHEAQGFFFSRAVSPDAVSEMLRARAGGWLGQPGADRRDDVSRQGSAGAVVTRGKLCDAT